MENFSPSFKVCQNPVQQERDTSYRMTSFKSHIWNNPDPGLLHSQENLPDIFFCWYYPWKCNHTSFWRPTKTPHNCFNDLSPGKGGRNRASDQNFTRTAPGLTHPFLFPPFVCLFIYLFSCNSDMGSLLTTRGQGLPVLPPAWAPRRVWDTSPLSRRWAQGWR